VAQLPVELILVRQLAHGLAVPTFVVDAAGDLVFVNEAAEALLGLDFEDAGQVSFADWTTAFASRTKGRQRADPATHPLAVAIRQRTPVHGPLVVTALPLEGSRGQLLGGLAMFWEPPTR
jgi:PAS domain-containing protein